MRGRRRGKERVRKQRFPATDLRGTTHRHTDSSAIRLQAQRQCERRFGLGLRYVSLREALPRNISFQTSKGKAALGEREEISAEGRVYT